MAKSVISLVIGLATLAAAASAMGQTTQPANELPAAAGAAAGASAATQPAGLIARPADARDIRARVVEVRGSVVARSVSRGGEFKPVAKGDTLPADTVVSVGPKGQAILAFGDNSVVLLEQFSIMNLAEIYQTRAADKDTVVTRLKLVNGSVRAGVERGRVQSDFQVTTPVATLTVRGTRPIRIFYDAGTGQLWFYLGSEGRIVGQLTGGGQSLDILPGEGTDQTLTLPLILAQFDYHVRLGDPWGSTLQEYLVEVFGANGGGGTFGGGNPQGVLGGIQNAVHHNPPGGNGDTFFDDDSSGDDTFYNASAAKAKGKGGAQSPPAPPAAKK